MSGDHSESVDALENKDSVISQDHRLEKWSSWVGEWQKVSDRIQKKIERPQGKSLIQISSASQRGVVEEKLMIQYAKINTNFDKYRGKPDFYELPPSLAEKDRQPKYFAVKSKEEQYIVPNLEQIAVPDVILQEKNILVEVRNLNKLWHESAYRKEQMKKYSEKIKRIVPHRAEMNKLGILGRKIYLKSRQSESAGSDEVAEKQCEGLKQPEDKKSQQLLQNIPETIEEDIEMGGLKISGVTLDRRMNQHATGSVKLRLNFEYDVSEGKPMVNYLTFENTSSTVLRIYWNKMDMYKIFKNLTPDRSFLYGFYFDKKELVILPGEKNMFPVWFQTRSAGYYTENWKIETKPRIWHDQIDVCLVLQSFAFYEDWKTKVDEISQKLEVEVKRVLIGDLIDDILKQAQQPNDIKELCVYEETQLFELANLNKKKQPQYLSDSGIIEQLKQFYNRNRNLQYPETWDYSVATLISLAQDSDINSYIKIKKDEVLTFLARTGLSFIQIPAENEGNKKGKKGKKQKAKSKKSESSKGSKGKKGKKKGVEVEVKQEEEQIVASENYIFDRQREVSELIRNLDQPTIQNLQRLKYFCCKSVMDSYFTKMCHLLTNLEVSAGVNRNVTYPSITHTLKPIKNYPDRLIYETYYPDYVPKTLLKLPSYALEAKPKPISLSEVPAEDSEKIFTTYFNRPLPVKKSPDAAVKGKKQGKAKKSKKEKTSSKGSSKGKNKNKKGKKEKPSAAPCKDVPFVSFDPYVESYQHVDETEGSYAVSTVNCADNLCKNEREDYKYKSYLVVRSCLSEAVDAVIDAVNTFDCVVAYNTITEVKKYFQEEVDRGKQK